MDSKANSSIQRWITEIIITRLKMLSVYKRELKASYPARTAPRAELPQNEKCAINEVDAREMHRVLAKCAKHTLKYAKLA